MLFLILSIFCSVTVGVIFKISRKSDVCLTQIVGINYLVALTLCYIFYHPDLAPVNASAPWGIYVPLVLLLPSVFILLATSVKHVGIARTDVAQRLSLFIPILAAWLIFKENFDAYKIAGLVLAFPALLLILAKNTAKAHNNWLYPLLVLVGFGIIDILFKQIALYTTLPYTTSLFVVFAGALAFSLLAAVYEITFKGTGLRVINLGYGALVGIFNFGNILFYLKAHQTFADNPSTVFTAMNMGVIVLGYLTGVIIFKEKPGRLNYLGILFALAAIACITLSQVQR
jgi:drug/metabolite transporter (DMT)-like permease